MTRRVKKNSDEPCDRIPTAPPTSTSRTAALIKCCLLWLSLSAPAAASEAIKVTFFSPAAAESRFFQQISEIMFVAASQFDLELDVIYGNHDPIVMKEQAKALFARQNKPDYLLMVNHRNATAAIMEQADQLGIKTLLFNGAFPPPTERKYREGEQALEHWIGQVLPDEEQAGWLVAERLVETAREAKATDDRGVIQIIGINGPTRSPTTQQRAQGLQAYVNSQTDVSLQQVVHADWDRKKARTMAGKLLRRHQNTSVIWTAADDMAVGAAEAILDRGLRPGVDIFTAGIDWLPVIFEPVESGQLSGSVGGHIFDGAWAMVVVLDHARGALTEFVDEKTQFHFSDKSSLAEITQIMQPDYWQTIDFRHFSKAHNNPDLPYKFGVELILPPK